MDTCGVSQADLDFIAGLYEGVRGLGKQQLLAALPQLVEASCDPEIEWVEDPKRADSRVYRGHAGVRESWARWLEDFDDYGFEIERMSDHGEQVMVTAVEHGRGSASGAEVTAHIYAVYTFRDGKVLRYQEFYDERDAAAALTD
jgi:ketosteroid isomerase-like protein